MARTRAERIEVGRGAAVVESIARNYIEDQQLVIVARLTAAYRAGTITHDMLVGTIGGLAALQDLLAHLESDRSQGDRAAGEEYGTQT